MSDFSLLCKMVVSNQSSRHRMWTEITRRKHEREGQRYASDVTDAEWALIEPHMPAAKPLGRPRDTELRDVVDAILYTARTGCQWRMLPKDFPPFTTVVCWSGPRCTPPMSKIAMGPGLSSRPSTSCFPWLRHLFADSVYNGPNLRE